jgi:hypothetical protein
MVATDEGKLRILFSDASRTNKRVVGEWASEQLDISTDPRQQIIIPKSAEVLEEDDLLLIEYNGLAASSVDYDAAEANTKFRIPVTIRNKRTGNVYERILRHPDLASADVAISAASTWYELGAYTVSAQEQLRLGHKIAENSRLYITLVENV